MTAPTPVFLAALALADNTERHIRTCGKCGTIHTDTDQGFALLGWGPVRRRLLCPTCMPKRLRGY